MLGMVAGCGTMNEADVASALLGLRAMDPNANLNYQQRQQTAYLSNIVGKMGDRQHEKQIAQQSRDGVNVYVDSQGSGHQNIAHYSTGDSFQKLQQLGIDAYDDGVKKVDDWIAPPPSYTCSGFEDRNGDGFIGKDELNNLGSYFEVKENGEGVHGSGSRIYRKGQFGEYIDCSNPLCYNGGFSIGSILREMVRNRQTELEESRKCQGYEGSPRGRCVYRDCWNSFEIRVSVKFKRDQTDINNQ